MRQASGDDLEGVCALWLELTRHHARLDPHFELRPGAEDEARRLLAAQLGDPDSAVFVLGAAAEQGAGAAPLEGLAIARVDRAPPIHPETCRAEISDLFVAPAARRRGAGRALARAAAAWAEARGAERLEVRVSPHNPEGQAFWRALGYGAHMDVLHRRL